MMATTRKRLEAWSVLPYFISRLALQSRLIITAWRDIRYDSYNQGLLNLIDQNPGFDLIPDMNQIRTDFAYSDTGAAV